MKTELKIYTVAEICDGFEYNELEGKALSKISPHTQQNIFTYEGKETHIPRSTISMSLK